jgi:hypothetical protein
MRRQPLADHHFLLVTPGEGFYRLSPAEGLNLQAFRVVIRQLPFAVIVQHAAGVHFAELRQADVLRYRQLNDCPARPTNVKRRPKGAFLLSAI